jgi:Tfp pilus assembly protein PilO
MKLTFAILGLLLAGGIFFFYTKPAYDGVQAVQAQIDQYNTALDKATQLQQLKQSLLSRYNAFNPSDLSRLQTLLPDHVDNVGLILDIDNLASKYGMALENVDVSTPSSVSSANATPITAIGRSGQKYDSLTMKFSTTGTYTNFLQFVTDLETSLRVVDLVSLSISPNTSASVQKGSAAPDPVYTYDITLRTYWLK